MALCLCSRVDGLAWPPPLEVLLCLLRINQSFQLGSPLVNLTPQPYKTATADTSEYKWALSDAPAFALISSLYLCRSGREFCFL